VVSWLLLRGRCRSCQEPIPSGYPLVELTSAILWVVAAWRFDDAPIPVAVAFAALFSVLLALSVIDLELYILPNRITYPSILVSGVVLPILSIAYAEEPGAAILWAYVGGLLFGGILLLTLLAWSVIMRKDGMGMGDVKLAILLGMWLGWLHPVLPLHALIASSLFGVIVGAGVAIVRRASQPYPFGPWLALGTIVVIVFSGPILRFQGFDGADASETTAPATASFGVVDGQ
ncbi:MAG: prepilin peptidase, partial [Acidimicrobiales bacterium]|nr:prepilin peptidase [Acidimicrobiales bacterium]